MSSSSSIAIFLFWLTSGDLRSAPSETSAPMALSRKSLHLVKHGRERGLEFERFFDLVGANERILAVFEETRALMLANEGHERGRIGLPIHRESLEIFEDSRNARGGEQRDSVLGVFVEVGVENALVHEVGFPIDGKHQPAQVVQF